MKKTSIVCTIGTTSKNVSTLISMSAAGMNVARINMSHGTHESHQVEIDNILKARATKPLALMIDTKGPEIRIKTFKTGKAVICKEKVFTFTSREVEGDESIVSLAYKNLVKELNVGDKIFASNGMIVLKVKELTQTDIVCRVLFGGILTNRKGLNIPHIVPKGPFLSDEDKTDLIFAIKNQTDYIAASFVSRKEDVVQMRSFLNEHGGENIKIISKIENYDGVKNAKEILEISDGIMIARGDLGVEIPLQKLPSIQKRLIQLANDKGKIVIIATEMLESMTESLRPTRAEVSDVANGTYEMATATMLSGETAIGKNPVNVVKTMNRIIVEAERNINYNKKFEFRGKAISDISDAIAETACSNAIYLKAKLIVVYTTTGRAAHMVSSYRVSTPILALTPNKAMFHSLGLSWNITPVIVPIISTEAAMITEAAKIAKERRLVNEGDIIVVVTGTPKASGQTHMMRIVKI